MSVWNSRSHHLHHHTSCVDVVCSKVIQYLKKLCSRTKKTLSARARYVETLIEHFRNRWRKEYLPALREHHKNVDKPLKHSVQVGDIVHIHKDKTPRQRWLMGKVTSLLPSKDGICQAVKVLCLDKSGKSVELKQPIQRLYPLELRAEQHKTVLDPVVEDNSNIEVTIVRDEDIPEIIK